MLVNLAHLYAIHKQQILSSNVALKWFSYIMDNIYLCCVEIYLHNAQTTHTIFPHTSINMTQHAFSKYPECTTAQYFQTVNRTDISEYTAITKEKIYVDS
jgi:hypothetical protein